MRSICALLLLPTAITAQEVCPTRGDVTSTGVLITFEDAATELHRETAPGQITISYVSQDYRGGTLAAYGIHALSFWEVDDDGRVVRDSVWVFSHVMGNDNLPAPEPGGTFESVTAYSFMDDLNQETVRHTWGPLSQRTFGACTYDVIPVSIAFEGEYYDHTEEYSYFPSLQTGVLIAYEDEDGRDEYIPVTIGLP